MKNLSRMLLLVMAVVTLAACNQGGTGPSKPAQSSSVEGISK